MMTTTRILAAMRRTQGQEMKSKEGGRQVEDQQPVRMISREIFALTHRDTAIDDNTRHQAGPIWNGFPPWHLCHW